MPNTREKLIYADDFLDLFYVASAGQDKEFIKTVEMVVEDTPTVSVITAIDIANGVTVQKWIPVTERLPEEKQLVLAVCKSGKIFVGDYWDCYGTIIWRIRTARDSTKNITQIVTHWMPLPEPPKGE